jgi:hypothetical protein
MVVYNDEIKKAAEDTESGIFPVRVALSGTEQRLILGFAERRKQLSEQRQQELANILSPLTGTEGAEGVTTLVKISNSLKGAE